MTDITANAEDVLFFDISDEALELAGDTSEGHRIYTLGACTGLSECPA